MQYINIGNHHFHKSKIIGLDVRKSLYGFNYFLTIKYAHTHVSPIIETKYTTLDFGFRYRVKDYGLLLDDIKELIKFPENKIIDTESLGIIHELKCRRMEENNKLE